MNLLTPWIPPAVKHLSTHFTAYLRFCWAGLAKHGQTGGLVPSQRFLIDKMIAPVPEDYRGRIIELGAGTGALTVRLAARCPQARISCCEVNPALAGGLEKKIHQARLSDRVEVFAGGAAQLLGMQQKKVEPADFIISGIPLANLGKARVLNLLESIHRTLHAGGLFIQFQHSLLDRKQIRAIFPHVRTVAAFLNIPPAFVYIAPK